jgi:hypothetical protein
VANSNPRSRIRTARAARVCVEIPQASIRSGNVESLERPHFRAYPLHCIAKIHFALEQQSLEINALEVLQKSAQSTNLI